MKRVWIYLINTFLVNTVTSMVKLLRIATDHNDRLEAEAAADPTLLPLYDRFNPVLENFRNVLSQRDGGHGIGKGKTQTFEELLELMAESWMPEWEGKVYYHYPRGTAAATAIFPRKRAPFITGSYEERIQAVKTLKQVLAAYAPLADLMADVSAKYDLLLSSRNAQKQQMGLTAGYSALLEKQRIELCIMLYRNLGALMDKYGASPAEVERFFNLSLLRSSASDKDIILRRVDSVESHGTMAVRLPEASRLSVASSCLLANTSSNAPLEFFFSNNASATDAPFKTRVEVGQMVSGTLAECGWNPGNELLIVKNDADNAGQFEIMIEKPVMEGVPEPAV